MSKILEALIAKGRRAKRVRDQKEVVFGLVDLTTRIEQHERIISKGGVQSLVDLLRKTQDVEVQRLSALGLANCAASIVVPLKVVEEALELMVKFMNNEDADLILKQYCALTIGNLAVNAVHHDGLAKFGLIRALFTLLKTEDAESGRYVSFALSNLTTSVLCRDRIATEGGIKIIIDLACSENLSTQKQALSALRGMCISYTYRVELIESGGLDPIVLLARSDNIEVLKNVATVLNCLSAVNEIKVEIANRTIANLIGMMMSGDPETEGHSTWAIANLLEMPILHSKFIEENGIPPLVALTHCSHRISKQESLRAISYLAANIDTHKSMLSHNILCYLIDALSMPYEDIRYLAMLSLANFSTSVLNQVKMIKSGILQPLVDIAKPGDKLPETCRFAALALFNMSTSFSNHTSLLEAKILPMVFSLCKSTDQLTLYYIGGTLSNLSCFSANHVQILEEGGLQSIFLLVLTTNPDVHQQGAAALRGLSTSFQNKIKIVQEGGLEPLIELLQSEDIDVLREVCAAMCNLSRAPQNKPEIGKSGAVSGLLSLALHDDSMIACHSSKCLSNISEHPENVCVLAKETSLPLILSAMRSPYVEVQRDAGRILSNVCADQLSSNRVIGLDGHQLFTSYLLSQDSACCQIGALGISNLSVFNENRITVMTSGALEPLCALSRCKDVEVETRRYALKAISNLACCVENHLVFFKEAVVPMLIDLSNTEDLHIHQYASFAISKIGQNPKFRQRLSDEGGLEPVFYLSNKCTEDILHQVLACLCSFSFLSENKTKISNYRDIKLFISLIRSPLTNVAKMACCMFANICELDENLAEVFNSGGLSFLLEAAENSSSEVSCEAIRAIGNLCRNHSYSQYVIKNGSLPNLIDKLHKELDSSASLRCMAALALCNISSNTNNHEELVSAGLLNAVIGIVKSSQELDSQFDEEVVRYSLLIIGNLSAQYDNNKVIMVECLELLSKCHQYKDLKICKYGMFALGNLSTRDENLEDIDKNCGIKPFICSSFYSKQLGASIQFQAVLALRGLSSHPSTRPKVIDEGGLEPILQASRSKSIEVQREAAAVLRNLCCVTESKKAMVDGGVLPHLIELCTSQDSQIITHAACGLANLVEMNNQDILDRIIESGCVRLLLMLIRRGQLEAKDIDAMSKSYRESCREGVRCIAFLSSTNKSHSHLMEAGAPVEVALLLKHQLEIIDKNAKENQQCLLLSVQYGMLALGNLALNPATHQNLIQIGILNILLSPKVVCIDDVEVRRRVAYALNNLASNKSIFFAFEPSKIMQELIFLLFDIDDDVCLHALTAVRRLAASQSSRTIMYKLRLLDVLIQLCEKTCLHTIRELVATLCNLSIDTCAKMEIVEIGFQAYIDTFINFTDDVTTLLAVTLLANLAEISENHDAMAVENVLEQMILLLSSAKANGIQREITRCIANFLGEGVILKNSLPDNTLSTLNFMISSLDDATCIFAVLGFSNLSTDSSYHAKILNDGALVSLFSVIKRSDCSYEVQNYAIQALSNISFYMNNHESLINANIFSLFIDALKENHNEDVTSRIVLCISNFACNPNHHVQLVESGIVEVTMRLLQANHDAIILNAVTAVHGFSSSKVLQNSIIAFGGVPFILNLCCSSDVRIQREALWVVCNFSQSGFSAFDPKLVFEALTLERVIAILGQEEHVFIMFGALLIGNIAAQYNDLNHNIIREQILVPLINATSTIKDREAQRCIAFSLMNICVDPLHRSLVVHLGGISSLISIALSSTPDYAYIAITTLRAISCFSGYRRNIINKGGAAILNSKKLFELDLPTQLELACMLSALSLNEMNKLDLAPLADTMLSLLLFTIEKSYKTAHLLMSAVANISENENLHKHLVSNDMMEKMMQIFSCPMTLEKNGDLVLLEREYTRFLGNISSNFSMQNVLIHHGISVTLSFALSRNDCVTHRFASLALMNMFSNKDNEAHKLLHQSDVLEKLCKACKVDADKSTYDLEALRYACLALGHASTKELHHSQLSSLDICSVLKSLMIFEDTEVVLNAVYSCNKLSHHSTTNMTSSLIPSITHLLKTCECHKILGQCIVALCSIARHVQTTNLIFDAGIIEAITEGKLARLCRENVHASKIIDPGLIMCEGTGDVIEIVRDVSRLFYALSIPSKCKQLVAESCIPHESSREVDPPLMCLCRSNDIETLTLACAAISNSAEDIICAGHVLLQSSALHHMILLMRNHHRNVQREAFRAVANLLSLSTAVRFWTHTSGFIGLQGINISKDMQMQYSAAVIFRKACEAGSNETLSYVANQGGVALLVDMVMYAECAKTRTQAAAAIYHLSFNQGHRESIIKRGGICALVRASKECKYHPLVLQSLVSLRCMFSSNLAILIAAEKRVHSELFFIIQRAIDSMDVKNKIFTDILVEAVKVLANLALCRTLHTLLVKGGVIKYLYKLSLLPEVQVLVGHIYASLSCSCDSIQGWFMHTDFDAIIDLANSSNKNCAQYAVLAIGNLAFVDENRNIIVERKGLLMLVSMLSCLSHHLCHKFAARTLSRICNTSQNQDLVFKAGVITPLLALLKKQPGDLEHFGLMACCNLCIHADSALAFAKFGGLPILLAELSDDRQTLNVLYAVMALCNLAICPYNQIHITKQGCLPYLISLASWDRGEFDMNRYAVMAFKNLACHYSNQLHIIEAGGVSVLCTLLSKQPDEFENFDAVEMCMFREACLAIYNISCTAACHKSLVGKNICEPLIKMLHLSDLHCRVFSIITLANLVANEETRGAVLRQVDLLSIFSLLKDPIVNVKLGALSFICNAFAGGVSLEHINTEPIVSQLIAILNSNHSEVVHCALMILINLSSNPSQHKPILSHDALAKIENLANSNDSSISSLLGLIWVNLCGQSEHCNQVVICRGVASLLKLATNQNPCMQCVGINALRCLSTSFCASSSIITAGVVETLVKANDTVFVEVHREIASCAFNLSIHAGYNNKMKILKEIFDNLVVLCEEQDFDAAGFAAGTLANLSEDVMVLEHISSNNGTYAVISLLNTFALNLEYAMKEIDMFCESLRATCNLLSSVQYQRIFIQVGIQGLINLGALPNEICQYYVALALRKLTPNTTSHSKIILSGGHRLLLQLVSVRDYKTRVQSAMALRNLSSNLEVQLDLAQVGCVEASVLLGLAHEVDLQVLACSILRHLSINEKLKRKCVDTGALHPLIRCITWGNLDLLCQSAGTLANLSENEHNKEVMLNQGIVQAITALSHIVNSEIQQDVVRVLANLATSSELHISLYKLGVVNVLMDMCKSQDPLIQKYSLYGLRFLFCNTQVCIHLLDEGYINHILGMAQNPNYEYQRSAMVAIFTATLSFENVKVLSTETVLVQIINLCSSLDSDVARFALLGLANIVDVPEVQVQIVHLKGIEALANVTDQSDHSLQRSAAKAIASMSCASVVASNGVAISICELLATRGVITSLVSLSRSLDLYTQRYSTLALCNLAAGLNTLKDKILECGGMKVCILLTRFPDTQIQCCSALTLAGLFLDSAHHNHSDSNKTNKGLKFINAGGLKPLFELIQFPDIPTQRCAIAALNAVLLKSEIFTREDLMTTDCIELVLDLLTTNDESILHCAVYALGSMGEISTALLKMETIGIIRLLSVHINSKNTDFLSACAYLLALLCEHQVFSSEENCDEAITMLVSLGYVKDTECSAYTAFALAQLSKNRELHSKLIEAKALNPLINMMAIESKSKHYAVVALLKLAENFENHLAIAQEGGLKALLQLGRAFDADDEVEHKAASCIGNLACNAINLLEDKDI